MVRWKEFGIRKKEKKKERKKQCRQLNPVVD
jgi:hypothetical protein